MELDTIRQAVESLTWTFAKTMPKCPHWYIVRSPDIEEVYIALFNATKEHGAVEHFYHTPRQYLYLGDGYKYWRMTDDLSDSKIINRCIEGDFYPKRNDG
ncbi:MAG: hypothetical protein LBC63_07575 [Holophagales bacterium]|jgi:hypothetical protein|nr:hypothetical protein [Holophagales bacterium]